APEPMPAGYAPALRSCVQFPAPVNPGCDEVWLPEPAWCGWNELPFCHRVLLPPCQLVPFALGCAVWYAAIHCIAAFTLPEARSACTPLTSTPFCESFVTLFWSRVASCVLFAIMPG